MISDFAAHQLLHWARILRDTHDDGQINRAQYEALCAHIKAAEMQLAPGAAPAGMLDSRGNVK